MFLSIIESSVIRSSKNGCHCLSDSGLYKPDDPSSPIGCWTWWMTRIHSLQNLSQLCVGIQSHYCLIIFGCKTYKPPC